MKKQKLLTKEILNKVPTLYANDGKDPKEVPVIAKFFTPWSNFTWYMTEYDPESGDAFGYVKSDFPEMGYFNMKELDSIEGPFGLYIERDIHFKNKTLADVMENAYA
jgi:hypothetical protein